MIDFLLGVPGKLKTIIDYLTTNLASTRTAKIDYLDAAVSTRALASTAVSNANYTAARAGYLDNINKTPRLDSPIAANLPQGNVETGDYSAAIFAASCVPKSSSSTTSTVYVDAVNITGSGVLNFILFYNLTSAATVRLTIDGVLLATASTTAGQKARTLVGGLAVISSGIGIPILEEIPFKSSLRIEHLASSAGTTTTYYKIRRGS